MVGFAMPLILEATATIAHAAISLMIINNSDFNFWHDF